MVFRALTLVAAVIGPAVFALEYSPFSTPLDPRSSPYDSININLFRRSDKCATSCSSMGSQLCCGKQAVCALDQAGRVSEMHRVTGRRRIWGHGIWATRSNNTTSGYAGELSGVNMLQLESRGLSWVAISAMSHPRGSDASERWGKLCDGWELECCGSANEMWGTV
ncbi:MAG: hypothetical protein Q9163_003496 [Psora crenata]